MSLDSKVEQLEFGAIIRVGDGALVTRIEGVMKRKVE